MPQLISSPAIVISSSPVAVTIPLLRKYEAGAPGGDIFADSMSTSPSYRITGTHTLAGAITIAPSAGAVNNMRIVFYYEAVLTTDSNAGNTITIFGYTIPDKLALKSSLIVATYNGTTSAWVVTLIPSFGQTNIILPTHIEDGTLSGTKLTDSTVTDAKIVGMAGSKLTDATVTGAKLADGTVGGAKLTDGGITAAKVADDAITNAKLAPMSQATVKVGSTPGGGVLNEPTDLDLSAEGAFLVGQGAGQNLVARVISQDFTISKLGVGVINNGVITTAKLANDAVTADKVDANMRQFFHLVPVSFEAGEQCDNTVKVHYKGQVDYLYGSVTKAIAATDDATITPKNNAGTTMTGGTLTFPASSPLNDAQSSTPTGNNSFEDGEVLKFITAKGTPGGKALLSVQTTKKV